LQNDRQLDLDRSGQAQGGARESSGTSPECRIGCCAMSLSGSNSLLLILSAPSGGGKTTLSTEVLGSEQNTVRAVTCTTRDPRDGEREGIDYYFLDPGDFLKRVQAGHFLEHATVYGNSYGTLKSEVLGRLRQGKDVLLNVDVQGAAAIREKAQ